MSERLYLFHLQFGFWPKADSSTGGWCQANQHSLHMWIWPQHSQLQGYLGAHLMSTVQYPLAPQESHSPGGHMGLTVPTCIQSSAQDCIPSPHPPSQPLAWTPITQEGTLKNPHLWLMLWFCGLKRQRRRKELLGAITMEPLYCLARALNDNGKPHYWLATLNSSSLGFEVEVMVQDIYITCWIY